MTRRFRRAYGFLSPQRMALLGVVAATLGMLAGCTYERTHGLTAHFHDFDAREPRGNTVTVCHGYGCQNQTRVRFSSAHIAEISKLMKKTKKDDTPHEERRAIAWAVGWMERHSGRVVGITDRPGMDYLGSGDPSQQDCVDEATTTTGYLSVLAHNGLIKHHTLGTPFSKGNILRGVEFWPHWTAVLVEKDGGQRFAVDSWIYENGENPAIVEAEKWYIEDLNNLPESTT